MIEEVYTLIQALDISAEDAEEIINIYFEFFADSWTYNNYLWRNIRVVRNKKENQIINIIIY